MTISSAPLRKLAIGHLYEAKNQGAFRWRNWVLSVVQCNPSCGLQVALGKSGKTERQVALIVIVIVIVRRVRNLQPATHIDFPCACERVCVFLIIRRTRTSPCATRRTSIYKGLATPPYKNVAVTANEMREGLSVSVCRHWHQTLCKLLQSETLRW